MHELIYFYYPQYTLPFIYSTSFKYTSTDFANPAPKLVHKSQKEHNPVLKMR